MKTSAMLPASASFVLVLFVPAIARNSSIGGEAGSLSLYFQFLKPQNVKI
jgi:hypothetical protein